MIESLHDIPVMMQGAGDAVSQGSYRTAFEAISADLEEQHDLMFQQGHAADGSAWAALKPATIKRKGHGIILIEFENLWQSLVQQTEDSIRDISEQSMTWGTSDRKAGFHQTGTKRMPARPPVGMSEETLQRATEHVGDLALALVVGKVDAWIE